MKNSRKLTGFLSWFIVFCCIGNMGLLSWIFAGNQSSAEPVTQDMYMSTESYDTVVNVNEDNSYQVTENISVSFMNPRHGIYRYIPYKGVISELTEDGEVLDTPYYADFKDVSATEELDISSENGNKVLRLGSEDYTVDGSQQYTIDYHITPRTTKGYKDAYYNVFPTGWRNEIPAGSSFEIHFPKDFDTDKLQLYYGSYGERADASELVDMAWNGTVLSGTLKEALPVGSGMTFYVPMEEGYFNNISTMNTFNILLIAVEIVVLLILLLLFFFFGRDSQIIPSIQFQPPSGLDSAAVGYIIDGSVSNEDITSLIIFWADRGFLKIRETKSQTLALTKIKELPADAPAYARILFDGMLGTGPSSIGKEVMMTSLKYKLADKVQTSKEMLSDAYKQQVYTGASKAARVLSTLLSVVPVAAVAGMIYQTTFASGIILIFALIYFIGLLLFNGTVDFWYSRDSIHRKLWGSTSSALCIIPPVIIFVLFGFSMMKGTMVSLLPAIICLIPCSVIYMILTGFMKKRTEQCITWMGYLAGLRDFIETAELDRMKVIAEDSPELFYHILPFAYVFGLSDILLDKMKELTLPAPDWYDSPNRRTSYFDYYLMHRMLHTGMPKAAEVISTPRPPQSGSSASRGGFSGGGFSGGGFSGGGFGGGGGGSW